ncbi:type IV pilin protein [Acinetobacter indicus]|uniref:type IV pilin protein n=1 Tax=Acinetobacter indicus TaxID=756892 RepID=UPI0014448614|nr:type IV pilin protein [Acinetobacter indicus]
MYKKQGSNFHTSSAGFTLLELMVAVIILAILAAIAMPMYSNYITKAKARSAQSDLVALSVVMESLYQRNLKYVDSAGEKTVSDYFTTNSMTGSWQPSADTFDYKLTVTTTTYSLKAVGSSGGRNDGCEITLTNTNSRSITGDSACGGLTSW